MKRKQTYYSLHPLKSKNCQYNILYGERSPGKSYAVKYECLKDAYEKKEYLIYLRRWREEIKVADVVAYFDDMVCDDEGNMRIYDLTKGKYTDVVVYMGKIWFANVDENGKKIRGNDIIGYFACLTGETHKKSLPFVSVYNFIFEEFITDTGYLPNEPRKLMKLVSTVFRRRQGRVWLIGNTISRNLPYFYEWNLEKCLTQKQGTIMIVHQKSAELDEYGNNIIIDIAVEYCKRAVKTTTMLFGKGTESMVTGEWETNSYLILPRDICNYKIYYTCYAEHDYFKFKLDVIKVDNNPVIYISRIQDFPEIPFRLISDKDTFDRLTTKKFKNFVTAYDSTVFRLLDLKKVAVEDNLCGTDFFSCFKF